MKYLFILLITPILLLGCAKEEDSTTSTSPDSSSGSMSFSGKVAQGYVEGAKVFADLDGKSETRMNLRIPLTVVVPII